MNVDAYDVKKQQDGRRRGIYVNNSRTSRNDDEDDVTAELFIITPVDAAARVAQDE